MSSGMTCPDICPGSETKGAAKKEAASKPEPGKSKCSPYVPGCVLPPEPKVYPPDAPPRYLPQPTDTTSGDFLGMGSIDPWAAGHLDWTPQSGVTGVRPVVDKYSITRYNTGGWRKNNEYILTPRSVDKAKKFQIQYKKDVANTFDNLDNKLEQSNKELDKRVQDLNHWKSEVVKAHRAIIEEIDALDANRARLKGACRILMLPEAISRECIELRTHRYEPDLVRDDAEQELIREVAIVGEIRRVFMNTLAKVEDQMANNKAAKTVIENDLNDKIITLTLDKDNLRLTPESNSLASHPGVVRWPENACSLEYWKHYCAESIRNCDDVRKKSEELRGDLMTAIIKGSEDMKTQADRTNAAFAETVAAMEGMCDHLEKNLKDNLQTTADLENLIDHLNESIRKMDDRNKLVMTRLHSRNYSRPNVENCRDDAQYAIMAEAKLVKESLEAFGNKLREAESVRSELMKYRGDLEKEIACKRKSLYIDKDRCSRIRAHMPTPEEFAAG
ncbi:tektin-4-like [Battus philenor]|uniref:tektin-4-like n=1 Tax=Battus philenor TaxID=42288 RepID=UPI0035CEDA95